MAEFDPIDASHDQYKYTIVDSNGKSTKYLLDHTTKQVYQRNAITGKYRLTGASYDQFCIQFKQIARAAWLRTHVEALTQPSITDDVGATDNVLTNRFVTVSMPHI